MIEIHTVSGEERDCRAFRSCTARTSNAMNVVL